MDQGEHWMNTEVCKERTAIVFNANAVGFCILLYLFLRVAVPGYVIRFFMIFMPDLRYFNSHLIAPEWVVQLITGISFILSCLLPYLVYAVFVRMPLKKALPLKKPRAAIVVPAIFIAMAAAVIGSAATNALGGVMRIAGIIPISPALSLATTPEGLLAALVNICILPAILEEFIYRGFIMQGLRRFGDGFALAVSSVLFGLLHLNLLQIPVALLMGLVIGYFVLRTGSIWTGVILHFFNNFLVLAQQLVVRGLTPRDAEIVNTLILLAYLVLGLIATVLLSRGTDGLFELKTIPSAFTMRAKSKLFFSSPAILAVLVTVIWISLQSIQWVPW